LSHEGAIPEVILQTGNVTLPPEILNRVTNETQKIPYQHLKYICSTSLRKPQAKDNVTYVVKPEPYWLQFKDQTQLNISEFEKQATYYEVRATVKNVDIATRKYDLPRLVPNNSLYSSVVEQAISYFSYIRAGISTNFEVNGAASTGPLWKERKFKHKHELFTIQNGKMIPKEILANAIFDTTHIPLFGSFTKAEALPFNDVRPISEGGREKIRLVQGPDCHFYMAGMFLFNAQNKRMIAEHATHWIKYGVTKEYGGFNQMLVPLEVVTLTSEGDTSHFDKCADLEDVYKIRVANNSIHPDLEEFRAFVVYFIAHPFIILPNGDIVEAPGKNPSGSCNTTPDNSIKHFLIRMYIVFKLLKLRFPNEKPTFQIAFKYAIYCIYSDDFLGGILHLELQVSREEYIAIAEETYAEFGMVLKKTAVLVCEKKVGEKLNPKHSFLGSYTTYDSVIGMYFPSPRIEKITSSFLYQPVESNLSKIDFLIRAYQLSVHCAPLSYYSEISRAYLDFLVNHDDFLAERVAYDNFVHGGGELKQTPFDTYKCTVLGLEGNLALPVTIV